MDAHDTETHRYHTIVGANGTAIAMMFVGGVVLG